MEYKVLEEMVEARGYKIKEIKDNIYHTISKTGDKIIVIFSKYNKLNIDSIKYNLEIINKNKYNHAIIIYNNNVTSSAKKIIKNLYNINIEIFSRNELQFNITKHRLSRPHIKVTGEEELEIREKYGDKLSIILKTDPQARFYGFCVNDIIKIIRKNGLVFYRIVK